MSNFVIGAASPLVQYTPPLTPTETTWMLWRDPTTESQQYADSFTNTSISGSSFRFSFYGTGVSIFGDTICDYTTRLDEGPNDVWSTHDHTSTATSNPTPTSTPHQSQLASYDHLSLGYHQLETSLTSCGSTDRSRSGEFQFSYAEVRGWDPSRTMTVDRIVDDSELAVEYSGGWTYGFGGSLTEYLNHTHHYTTLPGSEFSYTFNGTSFLTLRGGLQPVGTPSDAYSISLDGQTWNFSTYARVPVPRTLLFFRGGLDANKTYTLTGTNVGAGYFEVDEIFAHGPVSTIHPQPPSEEFGSDRSISRPAVIGLACGISLIFLILLVALFRRAQQSRRHAHRGLVEPVLVSAMRSSKSRDKSGLGLQLQSPTRAKLNPLDVEKLPPDRRTVNSLPETPQLP